MSIDVTPELVAQVAAAQACLTLAEIAYPNELVANRIKWASRILTDPDVGKRTYLEASKHARYAAARGNVTPWGRIETAADILAATGARLGR